MYDKQLEYLIDLLIICIILFVKIEPAIHNCETWRGLGTYKITSLEISALLALTRIKLPLFLHKFNLIT